MPDVQAAENFIRRMLATERRYFRDASKPLEEARKELLQLTVERGPSPQILSEYNNILRATARGVRKLAPAERVQGNAERLAGRQFDAVSGVSLGIVRQPAREVRKLETLGMTVDAWATATNAQLSAAALQMRDEMPEDTAARLFGDGLGRASTWRKALNSFDAQQSGALWATATGLMALWWGRGREVSGRDDFQTQAMAAIDERTTETCLLVHGQIRDLNKPFVLRGTPRYADKIQNPPFHWYCRTATVLYVPEFEDIGITTQAMVEAARAELRARRETGRRDEIHPAHATSKRGR